MRGSIALDKIESVSIYFGTFEVKRCAEKSLDTLPRDVEIRRLPDQVLGRLRPEGIVRFFELVCVVVQIVDAQ